MEGLFRMGIFESIQKIGDIFQQSLPAILMVSFIAAIWIYYLVLAKDPAEHHAGFLQSLRNALSFRSMFSLVLIRVLYIAGALAILICGFISMFGVSFFPSLIAMVILEVVLRLVCEALMVVFSIHEQICELNRRHGLAADEPEWVDEAEEHEDEAENATVSRIRSLLDLRGE